MYNKSFHRWCIRFKDTEPPTKRYMDDADASHYIDFKLQNVYEKINGKKINNTTQIPTDKILCTYTDEEVDDFIFTCYFES